MRRDRLVMLAGAAALAVVVVVVAIVVAGSGGGSSDARTTTAATDTNGGSSGTEAQSTFAGVPQHGDTLGKATAPNTMIVFEDPQCPYCRQWNVDTLPTVVQNYVRTGRLKIVYRGIVVIGTNSVAGLRGIYAAGKQNKLWNMAEALYERQGEENSGWITIPVLKDAAKEVGADPAQLVKDADTASVTRALTDAQKQASSLGINSTPTFGIQRTLGAIQPLNVTLLEPDAFTQSLDAALS